MTNPTRLSTARWLLHHTREFTRPLTISILARITGQLAGIVIFVVAMLAFYSAALLNSFDWTRIIWILVALSLVKASLRYLEQYAGHWVAFTCLQRLRELFFNRLIPQAPAATSGQAGSQLTDLATRDIDRVEVFFAHTFPPVLTTIAVPSIALTALGFSFDSTLAWTLVPFVLIATVGIPLLSSKFTWQACRAVAAERAQLSERLGDDIQGVREVLAFQGEAQRKAGLAEAEQGLSKARGFLGRIQGLRAGTIIATQLLSLIALILVAQTTGASTRDLLISLTVAVSLWGPASGIDDFLTTLDAALAAATRLRTVVDAPALVSDAKADPAISELPGDIVVQDLTFAYPSRPQVQVLSDVSLKFPAGQWSYVAGVSGSGKSSLGALLVRGWDPASGKIMVGEHDLVTVPLDVLRREVSVVSQRPTLLSGSITHNLRLAAPGASDQELDVALEQAGLSPWIASLPDAARTPLLANGANISGGQLQRLALARTLLARPRILVLDEALSQLDGETAAQIRQTLRTLVDADGLTVIEITHRVDLIPDAAPVTVLDNGQVVQTGTAATLRTLPGPFTQLLARA